MRRRSILIGAGLVCVALVAACGGSPASGGGGDDDGSAVRVYEEVSGLSGAERHDRLVQLAKEEGNTLSLYTSLNADVADVVVPEFKKVTGVEVKIYRADSETVLQRVLQESSAKFSGSDIVETNATEMAVIADRGLTGTYEGEGRAKVNKDFQYDGWTPTRFNIFTPAWNTKRVSGALVPKSWEDLADPKYDGLLSLEVGDSDWYMTLYGYFRKQGKSDAEIDAMFQNMVKGSKVAKGHSGQVELLSAGEFGVVGAAYSYLTAQARNSGAPVEDKPFVQPVVARANGAGVMKSSQHPATAMLFLDWYLAEGQKVLLDNDLTPAVMPDGSDPLGGLQVLPVDVKQLLAEGEQWSARYDELLKGGEKAPQAP